MAASSISCCQLKPPTTAHLPRQLRRACVAAAACVVIGTAGAMGDGNGVAMARETDTMAGASYDVVHVQAPAPARWSDRRQCPPWRANSLENIVPENLPRASLRRRFNSVTAAERTLASPDAVVPFLALHSGMGCFSL